ncbi:MAG TPA: Nif3-like dinuclear metal center hexameric protein [Methylophaga aminisulfidivorans]|uniref:GTP cyclohydrolase 1 type 2 homolog n=2 Tax=root TaxID=1 RepID=A0A7C1VZS6_9GAMM|nr:Nif3-like dinuclear metal center hexameric protein [Methylophaga aminisulfidivorans]
MITRTEFLAYINEILEPNRFNDYCPNGLQVEGANDIEVIVTGVTASEALLEAAIDVQADAILVHHGYFWRGEDARLIGMKQRRLKLLLENNVNLIAYHLPLDAHPTLGNNAQLAALLGVEVDGRISGTGEPAIGLCGCFPEPMSLSEVTSLVRQKLAREPLVIQGHDRPVTTVGWCTGAAQGYLQQAADLGLDLFISGEISEPTVHIARELGINYMAAGHHATERYGVKALGERLAEQFDIRHHFIDIDNPV